MTATPAPELAIIRTCPHAPHDEHVRMRAEDPISRVTLPDGREAWAVSRHEDIRAVLADPRFSPNRGHPNFPSLIKDRQPLQNVNFTSLLSMDPPEHGPARRAVVGEFTVKRMNALRPRIQQIVDEHIDAMLAGPRPADLVQSLSLPVPSLVICELLGVPYADHDFFQRHTAMLLKREIPAEQRTQTLTELRSYLAQLVTAKEAELPDDLLGRQIRRHREAGTYERGAMVGMAFLLLVAGHETTANMISLGTIGLLQHPEDLAAIKADPAKTLGAVEELLRYYSIVDIGANRVALEDVELAGVLIKAGEGVVVLGNMGNHDPEVFSDPMALDIDRGARHHVAFGFGAHQCLGQNLARMELQIVFDTLFARIPGLKLAVPADELPYKDDAAIYGVYQLPVTW
ncbi:cytochrome P450 [Amycolatopsis taiwanensis]|uniref:Cytochrome P450 n=1 Tax=Amycolatopsis taiwanensis TaxID=342230 RepID=A0A9W6RB27_9PSEU|nr:cytochrome P450 [Amycolatopsis taiwanensis]GLY71475.1 cytochrome P450 [Amycolatopsis taiwanensis]